jgi:hypothetical protein
VSRASRASVNLREITAMGGTPSVTLPSYQLTAGITAGEGVLLSPFACGVSSCQHFGMHRRAFSLSLFPNLRTLPLSGRQEAWGGVAKSLWWPVHSKGLFEVSSSHRQRPRTSAAQATIMQPQPHLQQFCRPSQMRSIGGLRLK